MSDPLGLSIGTTNLVAARVGSPPVIRRSTLSLFGDRTPQVGVPGGPGVVLDGFVERVGDPVPLVAADGTSYRAETLLVEALDAMTEAADATASGVTGTGDIAIAVPAHWGTATVYALRNALRTNPVFTPNGSPARLVSDAVASLTALHANPGLPTDGVVALLDFGGSGTSITLADAAAGFAPVDETTRFAEFSGDLIDQALLTHVLTGITDAGGVDPARTAAVGSLTRLREQCRDAKERLSAVTAADLAAELPGFRATIRITRTELEEMLQQPLAGVLTALDAALERTRIGWAGVSAVVTIGGGASIPLVTQQLSAHTRVPVVSTRQPALDAAVGAALFAVYTTAAEAPTGMAAAAPVTAMINDAPGSGTFGALAWSQDDTTSDEPVPYTGDDTYEPYNPYGPVATGARPGVQYLPAAEPEERRRGWHLPQLAFGAAAVVAAIAVGGVAYALTGTSTDSTPVTEFETKRLPASPPLPEASAAPPPPVVSVTTAPPAPPPPPSAVAPAPPPPSQTSTTTTTTPPPTTTTTTTTAATQTPTTTTPTTTTPTTTTRPTTTRPTTTPTTTTTRPRTTTTARPGTTEPTLTTTYVTVPFLPIPIPIRVPGN